MSMRPHQLMWKQLIQLDASAQESLQMQLRRGLTNAILDGQVSIDLPLPSSRDLAQQLQISRNTIVLAYQRLVDEGYSSVEKDRAILLTRQSSNPDRSTRRTKTQ